MPVRLFIWLLGSVVLGLVLLVLGLRGKRINDHPVCRQCRFDLSGRPEGTVTCPECGAGLKRPGSIRIGQRRRRPVWIGAGVLAAGLPGLAIATSGFALLTGKDVHQWLPLGALLWEARHADAVRQQQIAAEVLKRYTAKALTPSQIGTSLAAALDIQGNAARPWATEWGDLIEACKSDSKLKDEDERRFRNQAVLLDWKVRPRVRAGDPIPIVAFLKEARIGSGTALQSMVSLTAATIDGKKARTTTWQAGLNILGGFSFGESNPQVGWFQLFGKSTRMRWPGPMGQANLLLNCPKDLAPGRHSAKVSLLLQTSPQAATWTPSGVKNDPDSSARDGTLTFEVLPLESPGVEAVEPSADVKTRMENLLDPTQMQVTHWTGTWPVMSNYNASVQFNIDGAPVPAAFDVIWKAGDQEWPIGTFTTGASAGDNNFFAVEKQRFLNASVSGFDAEKVDVILRPSKGAALRTLDLERIYGAEIVYKDCPVQVQEQSMSNVTIPRPRAKKAAKTGEGESAQPWKDTSDTGSGSKDETPAKSGPDFFHSVRKLMWPW